MQGQMGSLWQSQELSPFLESQCSISSYPSLAVHRVIAVELEEGRRRQDLPLVLKLENAPGNWFPMYTLCLWALGT